MWEDQIVPTLRKRLENEAAYLSHRLSSGGGHSSLHVPAHRSDLAPAPFPYSPTFGPGRGSQAQQLDNDFSDATSLRTRTFSTVTSKEMNGRRTPRSDSSFDAPRSFDGHVEVYHKHRELPSGSSIPTRLGHVHAKRSMEQGRPRPQRSASSSRQPVARGSVELERNGRVVEGLIKNELPPFRIYADEAMRIAEKGHDLGDFAEETEEVFTPDSSMGSREVRKRSVTMRPQSKTVGAKPKTPGSGRHRDASSTRTTGNRSARSPSLNSSTSSNPDKARPGLAAHWIPPQTFTPPKGANWDDVVLPTVAKKLGIGVVTEPSHGEEDDLAVEWDKNGKPIKWIKQTSPSRTTGLSGAGLLANTRTSSPAAFDPPFERSPENPAKMTQTPAVRRQSSKEVFEMASPVRLSSARPSGLLESPSVSRRPSPQVRPSPRPSHQSMRSAAATQLRATQPGQSVFGTQQGAPWSGQTQLATAQLRHGETAMQVENQRTAETGIKGKSKEKKHDSVGSGCGCIIM